MKNDVGVTLFPAMRKVKDAANGRDACGAGTHVISFRRGMLTGSIILHDDSVTPATADGTMLTPRTWDARTR